MDSRHNIKRLDPSVVSRIAAGEVVKRPANAVKEMIENSLDAKATSIQVLVINGGVKYIQVLDNGHGIRKEDLEVVCERYTTSKLENFEDLQSINTYGFRGEALSSISHVSHVTLKTKTAMDKCGYEVSYAEGKPIGKPVPCAASQGTQITVENMFYNVPLRQKILKNFNEEFKRIRDIVARYAVHNSSVGFTFKKYSEKNTSIKTVACSNTQDAISSIFGADISRNLLEKEGSEESLQFKYKILVSDLIYTASHLTFLLFINNRLVKAEGLQKAVTDLYSVYLPRKTFPFVYISMEMAPENVDVNVHPAKENVFYLYEEFINKKIVNIIERLIMGKDAYKTYQKEALILSQSENNQHTLKETLSSENKCPASEKINDEENFNSSEMDVISNVMQGPEDNVATLSNDHMDVDLFLMDGGDSVNIIKDDFDTSQNNDNSEKHHKKGDQDERSMLPLPTLGVLKKNVLTACCSKLKEIIATSIFITCPDYSHMLIRTNNSLYICNLKPFCQEYFYQVLLNDVGKFGRLNLSEPIPVMSLIQHAYSHELGSSESEMQLLYQRLMENVSILDKCYGISIDKNGNLKSLPQLLDNYFPSKELLPKFILNLARNIPWDKECMFIYEVCMEIACYYSKFPSNRSILMNLKEWSSFVELTLFPSIKRDLWPSTELFSKHITDILDITLFTEQI